MYKFLGLLELQVQLDRITWWLCDSWKVLWYDIIDSLPRWHVWFDCLADLFLGVGLGFPISFSLWWICRPNPVQMLQNSPLFNVSWSLFLMVTDSPDLKKSYYPSRWFSIFYPLMKPNFSQVLYGQLSCISFWMRVIYWLFRTYHPPSVICLGHCKPNFISLLIKHWSKGRSLFQIIRFALSWSTYDILNLTHGNWNHQFSAFPLHPLYFHLFIFT